MAEYPDIDQGSKMDITALKKPRIAINIEFNELTFSVLKREKICLKSILKGLNGKFLSGKLTGIIGPSGAGKSTLTNILAGLRSKGVTGEILVNEKVRNLKSFQKVSCYIMQEDYLLPFLSIQELMESTAILKLGEETSNAERNVIITDILDVLSLKDCKSTRVSKLSGGEKKRLSMALELISNPPVMFFDEPTSGLDSQSSYQCINLLKKLAMEGRTIIVTIHQPSARMLEMFDDLYALAEGHCIYRGPIFGIIPFLSSLKLECPSYHNPADFLMELATGVNGPCVDHLVKAVKDGGTYTKTEFHNNNHDQKQSCSLNGEVNLEMFNCDHHLIASIEDYAQGYSASFFTQFSVLFKRTVIGILRDSILMKLRIATHLIVGLFIGALYYNVGNDASSVLSNIGCLFFSVMFLVFTALMSTMATFPLEMKVFVKEHLNQWYSLPAYYFAKTMADIPFQIVYTIMYVVIIYFMTNQPYELERFSYIMIISIMISLVAQTIGLAIGAVFNVKQGAFVGPVSTVPALLFAGFFVNYSTIPIYLRWMTYLSYIRYGYEGSVISIYGKRRKVLDCSEAFCMFKHPSKILEVTDIDESNLWFDFLMLLINFLVMRAITYLILRWKLKKSR